MPPKLLSDDGDHILIRPLAYCREKDIARWAEAQAFPIIPCDLCGSQDGLERQVIKRMLAEWERAHPARIEKIAGALRRVVPSTSWTGSSSTSRASTASGRRVPIRCAFP